ncbi:flagellin modification protein A [Vibrio tubiashii]|uniref:oxidoreductase n=1 Tax=Vibrio tubiashii TaxID=29498 RepID=UPI001EFE7454|nr:oxidoreductase [Vibrio tubiashii]MCG9584118.1 flagellin modification protein A [Vibrio tubiashii]MCG9617713.1 flagellin modification protein A [Vibrio tubiashii]MCG9687460.1 flagellin modification protein A [Vibrio tubiashii]
MKGLLSNQKVLVSGAGGLLGAKVSKHIIEQGAQVIAADVNLAHMRDKLIAENIAIESDKVELVKLDVTKEIDVKAFFSEISGISGAVNCTYPRNKTYGAHFLDVSLGSFNENLSLHLGSAFLFTQQCAAYFKKHQVPFSLVNISSVYGVIAPKFAIYDNTPMTMPVEYAAIKSAILHLNKYVTTYINDSRFRVNCVSPGGIFDHQPKKFLEAYKANTNGEGMLDVEDVVGAILFLLSEQSKFVTGQNLIVDDGFTQ